LVQLARQPHVPENLVPWLYRVVRNGAISAARGEERRRRHEQAASELRSWFCRSMPGEIDAAAATEQLAQLPIEEREAIVAHLWGGLPYEEIAQLQETSSSTAHRRYQSGLETLRRNLGAPCLNQKNPKTT
jgi:RNA polymerase sigma factor (sigma-70 family)